MDIDQKRDQYVTIPCWPRTYWESALNIHDQLGEAIAGIKPWGSGAHAIASFLFIGDRDNMWQFIQNWRTIAHRQITQQWQHACDVEEHWYPNTSYFRSDHDDERDSDVIEEQEVVSASDTDMDDIEEIRQACFL